VPITLDIDLTVNAVGAETITYLHTDGLGSSVAKTNASGVRISQTKYEAYGMTVAGSDKPTIGFTGHYNDKDTELTYMQQRYYDPVAGRFLSEDPVLTDANTGASFNRYVYANNNPYKYIDPDGRLAKAAVPIFVVVLIFSPPSRDAVAKAFKATVESIRNLIKSEPVKPTAAPPVPDKIVGDQSDPKAGPSNSGNRHVSGPLTPENGGVGNSADDLKTLTGGTEKPFPPDVTRPEGSLVGDNGVWIRPETKDSGARIEIPANGKKPPETLHYPKEQ
jgi:RHS repeat-associated protein